MGFIFWMSTGTFSAENTSSIIEPILRFLVPAISQQSLDMIHGLIRKCGHFTEYFILGLLLFRAFRSGSVETKTLRWAFFSIIIVIIYASSDEFHQSFVSTRTASVVDVGIDIAGGVIAQIISGIWRIRARK
jgi:VanZ family protein